MNGREPRIGQYRITKYDPKLRNSAGAYEPDEWTRYADVGTKVSEDDYLTTEARYVECACDLLAKAGHTSLTALAVQNPGGHGDAPSDGEKIETNKLAAHIRSVLRERYWCRFEAGPVFVHFDWDYYMYLALPLSLDAVESAAREFGLFAERMDSPILEEATWDSP